jgi:hypothetical protein
MLALSPTFWDFFSDMFPIFLFFLHAGEECWGTGLGLTTTVCNASILKAMWDPKLPTLSEIIIRIGNLKTTSSNRIIISGDPMF